MHLTLALLIFLPLIEIFSSNLAKNHHKIYLFFILFIASFSFFLSYNLVIDARIYVIDFGFIKLKFMCDIYAYFFGILVNIVWFITNLYSYSYATLNIHKQQIASFFRYLSLSIFAVFGICYAGDLITTFIFTTLLTLFTAPLIILLKNKETVKAKNLYLLTHLGSDLIFMMPAFYLIYHYTGNLDFVKNNFLASLDNNIISGLILFLLVFGLSKNCIIPFHRWLIKSTIAPVPVSGLLYHFNLTYIVRLVNFKVEMVLYIYPIVKAGFFNKNPTKLNLQNKIVPFTMRIAIAIAISLAIYMSIFINQIINFFHQYV